MSIALKLGSRRGLTLIEVVVGLTILSVMSGAIYNIVSGAVEATTSLNFLQAEDRRVESFLRRARNAFAHLPPSATLELKLVESQPLRQELTFRGVGNAFVWGEHAWWDKPVVTLGLIRWPDDRLPPPARAETRGKTVDPIAQRFSFAKTVPDFYQTSPDGEPLPDSLLRSRQGHQYLRPDQQGRFWVDLLPEVDRVEWRFYDPAKKVWVEQSPAARPPLIELRISLPGRKLPLRAVFETA
jgi:prepilin-type N-terminal cleavage/methylation domain-containing protein